MAEEKIFSVQPRFRFGDSPSGWALVDGIFKFGEGLPPYGTEYRDAYLSLAWFSEPMTAGVFSTWIEKAQTVNWKVTGGKVVANKTAYMLHNADDGAGWDYHEGVGALDYLTTDKGSMEEFGREVLIDNPKLLEQFRQYTGDMSQQKNYQELQKLLEKATTGRISGLSHIDAARLIKFGYPNMRWRYYPEENKPVFIPDGNLLQICSMPSARDRFVGFGHCALTRIIDAKQLMLGYLTYFRQEVGDLPPELVVIINGLSSTAVENSLKKYKLDREAAGNDVYGKIWWLGSDDPMTPVQFQTQSLISSTKTFDYRTMVEWWIKLLSLNVGEDVGEFWLLQRGESKTVQSIQAMKSKGKGVAKYLQAKERAYNVREVVPYGCRFEYDNPDDDADQKRIEILASKIGNLATIATIGVDRQEPAYSIEEIKKLAMAWEIVPPEVSGEEVPYTLGAMLKEIGGSDTWVVHRDGTQHPLKPIIKGRDQRKAEFLYHQLKEMYVPKLPEPVASDNGHRKEPVGDLV